MNYDITFERDPLDRADPPADWGEYIPFDGEVYPPDADPACPPTEAQVRAADAFDRVLTETGDVFAAWEALDAELGRDGRCPCYGRDMLPDFISCTVCRVASACVAECERRRATEILDACDANLISIQQTADAMRELDGDGALPLEPSKSKGIMFK